MKLQEALFVFASLTLGDLALTHASIVCGLPLIVTGPLAVVYGIGISHLARELFS